MYGLYAYPAEPPGHFEIQKKLEGDGHDAYTSDPQKKFRNTRNMGEVANRWVLKCEKIIEGALGCADHEKNIGATESHVLSEKNPNSTSAAF